MEFSVSRPTTPRLAPACIQAMPSSTPRPNGPNDALRSKLLRTSPAVEPSNSTPATVRRVVSLLAS